MPSVRQQAGVTLVEMIVTIVLLAIALVTVAYMVRQGSQQSADVMLETRATALGQAYLDEIMGRRFDERSARSGLSPCYGLAGPGRCSQASDFGPGIDSGESSRGRWDDVDDYHGYAEGDGEATPLQDAEGIDRDGYENFRVSINVRYAGTDTAWGGAQTDAKLITVNVRHRSETTGWDFSVYKGNY